MCTWITKGGKEIPYRELSDEHLLNILKYIERLSKEGYKKEILNWEAGFDYPIPEIVTLYGKDVFEELDYYELRKEAERRGLL